MATSVNLDAALGKGDVHFFLRQLDTFLTCPEEHYTPPEIPVDIQESFSCDDEFGEEWKQLYNLGHEFCFLNHGAFGAALKDSLKTAQEYQRYVDTQPLKVLDRETCVHLTHVLREMSKFIGCNARDLALVENATQGINTVLRSLRFSQEDTILTLSIGYGAVERAVSYVCEVTGAKQVIWPITLPITGEKQILDAIQGALDSHANIKLVILDHIPSCAAVILPIKEMVSVCQRRGCMVLVDGAHSLGQVELRIDDIGADFYATNCHKWFCNTRGSALLHVRRDRQSLVRPLSVSWGHGKGFQAEFLWSGTQYYSQYISLLTTLNFWKTVGPSRIRERCMNVVKQAEKLLREAWKVEQFAPDHMIGMMAVVRLPGRLNDDAWMSDLSAGAKRQLLQDYLYHVYKIEVPVRVMSGGLYLRLSCHIYNELSEYIVLNEAILEIAECRNSLRERLDADGFNSDLIVQEI